MEDELRQNLVFIMENLSSLTLVLAYLEQSKIISKAESDEIKAEKTSNDKNYKLLSTLQKKNWQEIRKLFLEILQKTNNTLCAQKILETSDGHSVAQDFLPVQEIVTLFHPKINKKWWPVKKLLIKSLLKRNLGQKLLIDELHDRISRDENRMIVLCESQVASKYSGMGGVGKTFTAKWYANIYEQKYDHIIWIDCGEDSLLKSFERLAMDLKIPNRNKFIQVEEFSGKCFDALTAFKCLWIYDNAENYKGKDGIINVLPKDEKNFYCIITSRSREWGTETAFGKISDLQLDIFSEEESLDFLNRNLKTSIERTESQLKELCQLMGNLPLALQLTVAALNSRKIELQNYIENTSTTNLENIFDKEFDDYEKTINECIRISLNLILKQENGKMAYEMLMIFGYIRPDDISSLFLSKILNIDPRKLEAALNLLETYSLITKTGKKLEFPYKDGIVNKLLCKNQIEVEMDVLGIHRLLQQVIRHNGRETENKTLKMILRCVGLIDYKFIPFTKYADEELRKEFPKVRAELLDQKQLKKLIGEGRLEESVELAKFIDKELHSNLSKFNLAVCLAKNEQLKESFDILKELEKGQMIKTKKYSGNDIQMGILGLEKELSKDLVHIYLKVIQCRIEQIKTKNEGKETRQSFEVIYSEDLLGILIHLVHSDLVKSNYSLLKYSSSSTIKLELGGESNVIKLSQCSLDLSSFDRLSPKELQLDGVSFNRNGREVEEANINEFCDLHKINQLTLSGRKMSIELSDEISMEYLYLERVKVLNWKEARWNIQKLRLLYIPFVEKTKMKVKEMDFRYSSLDISCLPPTIEKLLLDRAEVVCNEPIDLPNLKYLTLEMMSNSSLLSFFRSPNLTHIHFYEVEEMNVYRMPKSLTHIKISNSKTIVVGGVRRVDKLILQYFSVKEVEELLGHFQTDELVVESGLLYTFTPKELIELTKKEIKRIAVGRMNWKKEDLSILSSHVDRIADYYLWEGGRWRGMEKEEFDELMKLY